MILKAVENSSLSNNAKGTFKVTILLKHTLKYPGLTQPVKTTGIPLFSICLWARKPGCSIVGLKAELYILGKRHTFSYKHVEAGKSSF